MVLAGKVKENPNTFYKYIKRIAKERIGLLKDQHVSLCVEQ